ncbi:MAG: F0F1 ATP synthase subunit A [Nitrospirae bacterium]|nr:F0F1 ATP synthase subunit A [Candidatus Troglogloeales bacterium]MBI3598726.1 F0F1 ATP synthase subunit A [Candidatus Troglogloeales bacterium]
MASEQTSLEAPNIITLLHHSFPESPAVDFLHHFEVPFFSAIVILGLAVTARMASKHPTIVPGKLQNAVEFLVDSLDQFVCGVMGPIGRQFTPFIGTLFLYILSMNLIGLVPGMHSPTSNINTTVALAVTVFFYVQYTGICKLGISGYLDHLAGSPRPKGMGGYLIAVFIAVPFNFVLHTIGEIIKPLSLSVRLFGNIFGEDVLIGQMMLLGILALSFIHSPVGIPLQFPFYLLAILTSIIQAVVFSLLSVIYIFLMLPHEAAGHHT